MNSHPFAAADESGSVFWVFGSLFGLLIKIIMIATQRNRNVVVSSEVDDSVSIDGLLVV